MVNRVGDNFDNFGFGADLLGIESSDSIRDQIPSHFRILSTELQLRRLSEQKRNEDEAAVGFLSEAIKSGELSLEYKFAGELMQPSGILSGEAYKSDYETKANEVSQEMPQTVYSPKEAQEYLYDLGHYRYESDEEIGQIDIKRRQKYKHVESIINEHLSSVPESIKEKIILMFNAIVLFGGEWNASIPVNGEISFEVLDTLFKDGERKTDEYKQYGKLIESDYIGIEFEPALQEGKSQEGEYGIFIKENFINFVLGELDKIES